jgi:hypothetical protein
MNNKDILNAAPKGAVSFMKFDGFYRFRFSDGHFSKCIDCKSSIYTAAIRSIADIECIVKFEKSLESKMINKYYKFISTNILEFMTIAAMVIILLLVGFMPEIVAALESVK